jgi:hypothetical protein
MSADNDQGQTEHVRAAPHQGALVEPVVVHDRSGWHRVWRFTRLGFLVIVGLLLIALAIVWLWRKPIADDYIRDELKRRGVQATYTLDRVGFRTQQISNLVIGDPANPDLTVRRATIQLRIQWNGSFKVYRVAANGVRLKGKLIGNKVSWGQIDKLLPPPTGKPFTLPDLTVDLTDTTVALASPYGPMGFAVAGRGNLSGGFKGKLAMAAPRLRPGACALDQFRAFVDVGVVARRPQVSGPIGAVNFACPASNLRLTEPRAVIDSSFSEAFGSFDGHGRLTVATLVAGANGLAGVTSNVSFKGTATQILGGVNLAARQARLADIVSQRTRFDGRYRIDARRGALVVLGNYGANAVALAPSMMAMLTDSLDSAEGTPLGPIAKALSANVRRAGSKFDVDGSLRLVNQPGGGAVRVETADVRSASGATVNVSGGDGVTYYWPTARLRVDGDIAVQGGGLPTARLALRQPRSGAPMSGTADIAPMAAGGARLALATVRFAGGPGGWTQVSTVALLDGPFSGGRVTGLRIPISGRFGKGGALRFGEACVDTRFSSLAAGALRLGPARFPICPTGSAILLRQPGGELAINAAIRNLRLRGRMGQSPFGLDAASVRFSGDQFSGAGLSARMGRAEAPVLINARTVAGTLAGGGANGTFADANAVLGNIPLKLTDAAGKWRVRGGTVAIDGGLTLSHRADPPNFYPLRSDDVHFTLANSLIRATGTLKHPASGTPITNVTIAHNLNSGNGDAILDVPGITFGPGLQPEELTRLTEGVVALVKGRLSGQGRIAWTGGGKVTSTGDFTTQNMDLAASFGPITGMSGTIHFTDLLGLQTAPGQLVTLESINPGILVENGVIRYQLLPDNLVKVERGEWPFMGGRLILQETILNFGRPSPKRLTFEVVGLDAKTFVDSMGFKELSASGTFDGVLPMIFDDEGGRIVGGRLDSREGGGTLSYNGVVNKADLGMMGSFAFDALRDLKFKSMIIRLDGYLDGEFATRLAIQGVGLGNTSTQRFIRSINKIPFNFNVTIKGPFRALIATAKSFRDPTKTIEPALPRPLDQVPGIIVETRRIEEEKQQSQTPVDEKVTKTPAKQP